MDLKPHRFFRIRQLSKYLLIMLCVLSSSQIFAEIILGGGIRVTGSCGNQVVMVGRDDKLRILSAEQNIDKDVDAVVGNFTQKVLTSFHEQQALALDLTAGKKGLRELKANPQVLAARNHCKQYLDANYQLIASALSKNQKNQHVDGYIPFNVADYFLGISKKLYRGKARNAMFQALVNTYLADQPVLRDYLLDNIMIDKEY